MLGKILRIGFKRQHVCFYKGARALPQILDFRRKREIHTDQPFAIAIFVKFATLGTGPQFIAKAKPRWKPNESHPTGDRNRRSGSRF